MIIFPPDLGEDRNAIMLVELHFSIFIQGLPNLVFELYWEGTLDIIFLCYLVSNLAKDIFTRNDFTYVGVTGIALLSLSGFFVSFIINTNILNL